MVDLGLKVFVFREADKYEYTVPKPVMEEQSLDESLMREQAARDQTKQRQREFSKAIAMIAVGLPLYLYHWKTIQKENKKT